MRFLRRSLLAVVLGGGLIAGGLIAGETAAQQETTVTIGETGGSGMTGTAMLRPMGNQTMVTVQLQNAPGPHPIHFHEGTCASFAPQVKIPLTTVQNGTSETTVDASVSDLMAMPHVINVHKSPQEAAIYVACGDVAAGAQAQQTPAAKPGAPAPAKPGAAPAPAKPAASPAPAAAPAQAPRALPRTGETENWLIGGLMLAGVVILGAGLVARRRRT